MNGITINIYGCNPTGVAGSPLPAAARQAHREEQGVPVFRRLRISNGTRQGRGNQVPKRLRHIAYQPRKYDPATDGYVNGTLVGAYNGLAAPNPAPTPNPYTALADLGDKQAQVSHHPTYGSMPADQNPTRIQLWLSFGDYPAPNPDVLVHKTIEIEMPDEKTSNFKIGSLDIEVWAYMNAQGALKYELEYDMIYGHDEIVMAVSGEKKPLV